MELSALHQIKLLDKTITRNNMIECQSNITFCPNATNIFNFRTIRNSIYSVYRKKKLFFTRNKLIVTDQFLNIVAILNFCEIKSKWKNSLSYFHVAYPQRQI